MKLSNFKELLGKYVLMEQYYMTQSVQKAIAMDTVEDGAQTRWIILYSTNSKTISTVLFWMMFSLLCAKAFGVLSAHLLSIAFAQCSTMGSLCWKLTFSSTSVHRLRFFRSNLINSIIHKQLGYPSGWTAEAYQTAQSAYSAVLQQGGKGVTEMAANSTEKQRQVFLVAVNNLRTAIDCVGTLKVGLAEDFQKHLTQVIYPNSELAKIP